MNNSFKNTLNNEAQNESKWAARLAYKCGFCGKEFDNIPERAECELKCHQKQEKERKLAEARKKAEEKDARKKAVDEAFNTAYELKKAYIEDYGRYTYTHRDADDDIWMTSSFADFVRMLP